MPEALSRAIGEALGSILTIREAYLPNLYIQNVIDPPAQVLVVVLEHDAPKELRRINEVLRGVVPDGFSLDIFLWWPNEPLLPTVRRVGALDLGQNLN